MTTSELLDKFLYFEKKYNVFNFKTDCGIYWWDIARYSIYTELNNTFIRKYVEVEIEAINNKKNLLYIFTTLGKDILYLFKSLFFKKKFFFVLCSRSKNELGKNFDIIANPYLKTLHPKEIFCLETFHDAETEYISYKNTFLSIIKRFKKSKSYTIDFEINKLLNEYFGTNINFYEVVQKDLNNYVSEYTYYKQLLKFIKPNYCFVVQNGIQKGLFAATSDLNIKCIELQHGQINSFHIAYSYANEIDYSHLNLFPKVLFTYSEFWNKVNYPVIEKINMGLENKVYKKSDKRYEDIAVVFANIYTKNLLSLVKELAPNFKNKIYIKLHPNQKNEINYIKNELTEFTNIQIIYIEKTMDEILSLVSSIIIIQSTSVYEALQKEKKVFVYKKQDYDTHFDVFSNKNVYLIENIHDFFINKDKPFVSENQIVFFEPFKKNKFLSYIKENI